ncbi:MAG: ATP-dependent Clp protease proteolytic subunit [Atopobiaceae bacterium]|nr:ATP-dependent Clp protease proteolytic subunit [Atopobiaceae bacterium]
MDKYIYPTPSIIRETSQGYQSINICDEMFARREIECVGDIDETTTYSLCQQIRQLAREDECERITIFFNSPGGEVQSGLAIYDVMQAVSCPIRTVCLGMAASMAALLFVSGDERLMLPHSRVMIHDPLIVGGVGGSALELKTISDNLLRTRQVTAEVIAKHTGHGLDEVLEKTSRDSWFEASAAVEWNLADRIITSL